MEQSHIEKASKYPTTLKKFVCFIFRVTSEQRQIVKFIPLWEH